MLPVPTLSEEYQLSKREKYTILLGVITYFKVTNTSFFGLGETADTETI